MIMREFQKTTNQSGNNGQIKKTLNILLTMYHAYELMVRHGLRAFYKFYQSMCLFNTNFNSSRNIPNTFNFFKIILINFG